MAIISISNNPSNPFSIQSEPSSYTVTFNLSPLVKENGCHVIRFIKPTTQKCETTVCETTVDIASINSHAYSKIKKLFENTFTPTISKELGTADEILLSASVAGVDQTVPQNTQVVAVFDLKDHKTCYLSGSDSQESIQEAEEKIFQSFSTDAPKSKYSDHQRVQELFQRIHPTLICEGSIKYKLLTQNQFSPEEIEFLQKSTHDGGGSGLLCQYTEFVMTAHKLGYQALLNPESSPIDLKVEENFRSLGESFKSCEKSIVILPPSYQTMAQEGPYSAAVKASQVFSFSLEQLKLLEQPFTRTITQFAGSEKNSPSSHSQATISDAASSTPSDAAIAESSIEE